MLDKGEYAEGFDYVYVKLWDSGVNPANVALYCDMLIQRFGGGMIVMEAEISSISWRNIDYQSSGYELVHIEYLPVEKGTCPKVLYFLRTNPKKLRHTLYVPPTYEEGFCWDMDANERGKLTYPHYQLPPEVLTRYDAVKIPYGYSFVLNFSVCGEFDLSVYFVTDDLRGPILLFQKGFCCK